LRGRDEARFPLEVACLPANAIDHKAGEYDVNTRRSYLGITDAGCAGCDTTHRLDVPDASRRPRRIAAIHASRQAEYRLNGSRRAASVPEYENCLV
jgi:hypothetical protein